jgi:hypothetical protein
MKLSPPASSSDIEAAREIARRLHQRRRRADRPGSEDQPASPGPAPFRAPRPRPEPALVAPPSPPPRAFETVPEPPSWDEPAEEAPPPGETGDPLAAFSEPAPEPEVVTDAAEPPPDMESEGATFSPEEMIESAEPESFEATPEPEPYAAQSSPFEVDLDESEAPVDGAYGGPAPPSWDDIVETCLGLSQATGAMLVDPSGQVFAARGEWPEPGPDAIAAKLVSTMNRTLKDAPTRSISAPLVGKYLTAWRVPLAEGLVTAAFIGDAPIRAETRPAIDTEIHRGAGA